MESATASQGLSSLSPSGHSSTPLGGQRWGPQVYRMGTPGLVHVSAPPVSACSCPPWRASVPRAGHPHHLVSRGAAPARSEPVSSGGGAVGPLPPATTCWGWGGPAPPIALTSRGITLHACTLEAQPQTAPTRPANSPRNRMIAGGDGRSPKRVKPGSGKDCDELARPGDREAGGD